MIHFVPPSPVPTEPLLALPPPPPWRDLPDPTLLTPLLFGVVAVLMVIVVLFDTIRR